MNIFAVDEDPQIAAKSLCNQHCVKMLVESVQLLCTYLVVKGILRQEYVPYKATHTNHPCAKWLRDSPANVSWLALHTVALNDEFEKRFGKKHKTMQAFNQIDRHDYLPNCCWQDHTPFALAMPDEWKNEDRVLAYRCYYIAEKSRFAKWAPRAVAPHWWPFPEEAK